MKPTYEQLLAENTELKAIIKRLEKHIAGLEERIADLESQLTKNSKNSSKPPSTDWKSNVDSKKKAEKRPYHPGASRKLLPEASVTSRDIRELEECPRCSSPMEPIGEVFKWQQLELPEIKLFVHQIELHNSRCPHCRFLFEPTLENHESFLMGPRLESFANLCLGQFRQSHRGVREFLSILLPELKLSQGVISKLKSRTARALSTSHDEIMEKILSGNDPVHIDATGWRHCGKNEHAVVVRSENIAHFALLPRQNGETLASLFGGKKVLHLVSDRGLAAGQIACRIHQYCLAHLIRNVRGLAEHPNTTLEETALLGEMYDVLQELFHDKHRLDRGEIKESTWRHYGYEKWDFLEMLVEELLSGGPSKRVKNSCTRMLKDWQHFKVYLRCRGHPMTNNPAEEALRNLVITRKLCFGSRSEYGKVWRSVMQSCLETLRRQGHSVLDFLTDTVRAFRMGEPCPSLPS